MRNLATELIVALSVVAYLAYSLPFKEFMVLAIGLAIMACCIEAIANIIRS